jgi:membrane complex biogenesis BtpA family protein
MDRHATIAALFGVRRALIGMVHVGALPGTPAAREPLDTVVARACDEARAYRDAGYHGIIVENMHDLPYLKGSVGPEITAAMAVITRAVRDATDLTTGVQVLAAANREALAVALAGGASFVRVEGFVFAHVADEGTIEASAGELLRYRRAIGADHVRVFADIKKKHAAHAITADVDIVETARAAEFCRADGVVVTGAATGREADAGEVGAVAAAVGVPVLVGSGLTPERVPAFAAADGYIVGSSVKRDGDWSQPLDRDRVAAMADAFRTMDGAPRA